MEYQYIIPLFSLTGIIISAVISWIISKRQVSAGIDKIRYELQNTYVEALQKERIKLYPNLFASIEQFVKSIQKREITFDKLKEFYLFLDNWHTANGLILSFDTNSRIYKVLRKLSNICGSNNEAWLSRIENDKKRQDLIRESWEIELGLKNDIGVFQVEFFDPEKNLRSYHESNLKEDDL